MHVLVYLHLEPLHKSNEKKDREYLHYILLYLCILYFSTMHKTAQKIFNRHF